MPARKSADGAVANLVRPGREQPQRFRAGSSASTVKHQLVAAAKAGADAFPDEVRRFGLLTWMQPSLA